MKRENKLHQNVPHKFGPTIAERIEMKDVGEVFGFRLMGTMDEYLQRMIEIRLNQFVSGVTDGLVRFVNEVAEDAAKRAVQQEIKKVTSSPIEKVNDATETKGKCEPIESISADLEIDNEDPIVVPHDFVLPRLKRSGFINWSGSGLGTQKIIFMYLMRRAEKEMSVDISQAKNFKSKSPDFNGAYQRAKKIFNGGWNRALQEYKRAVFEDTRVQTEL